MLLGWMFSVDEVVFEGNKIVPTKPKMFLTCSLELEVGAWVLLK